MYLYSPQQFIKIDVCNPLHTINKINVRALIGQLPMVFCASKPRKNRASSRSEL